MRQAAGNALQLALRHALQPAAGTAAVAPAVSWGAHARGFALRPEQQGAAPGASAPSTSYSQQQQPAGAASRQPPRHVIYKGRWIKIVRYAVRCKVAQLMGAAGVAVGLAGMGATDLSLLDALVLGGIVTGSVGGSLSLWYYGRRYVGELSLLDPARDTLRFSVLDVWGNREDVDVPLPCLAPPFRNMPRKAVEHICNQLLFPVNCEVPRRGERGQLKFERRQFYVSVVAGQLLDGPTFMKLLMGDYKPPGAAAAASCQQAEAAAAAAAPTAAGGKAAAAARQ